MVTCDRNFINILVITKIAKSTLNKSKNCLIVKLLQTPSQIVKCEGTVKRTGFRELLATL